MDYIGEKSVSKCYLALGDINLKRNVNRLGPSINLLLTTKLIIIQG